EILVEREYDGAMLQRNRSDECINRCKTHAPGARQPENRGRFPVGSEAAWLEHFPLGKILLDPADVPRQTLKDFRDYHAGQRKRLSIPDHPAQLIACAPGCTTEKISPHRAVNEDHLWSTFGSGAGPPHPLDAAFP